MSSLPYISGSFIDDHTSYHKLIEVMRAGFASTSISCPNRHHHQFKNQALNTDTTMLIMPAWKAGDVGGVKVVNINPGYHQLDRPSIQGAYLLMDANNGDFLAVLDGAALTAKRTAATSALASSYLSKEDSNKLLMIGTGTLSAEMVKAHSAVRPIKEVRIWGRNSVKVNQVIDTLGDTDLEISPTDELMESVNWADIICCATSSETPLISGEYLREGQHLDLVGSFKPHAREADDEVIKRSKVYLDELENGMIESGDVVIPLKSGILKQEEIVGDLFQLSRSEIDGRKDQQEISLFKSVGHAVEDLVAAKFYLERYHENI